MGKIITNRYMPKKNHQVTPIGVMGKEPLILPNYSGVKRSLNEGPQEFNVVEGTIQTLTSNNINVSGTVDGINVSGHDHGIQGGATVSHQTLSGIGTKTHSQIDTHIADSTNPHGSTLSQSNMFATSQFRLPTSSGSYGEGTMYVVYDSRAGTYTLYARINNGWRMIPLT
jgi:hypothetical protein